MGSYHELHKKLLTYWEGQSLAAESIKALRANIDVMNEGNYKSILVTSTSEGEGKSITATNLAVAFAQSGKNTIYIDSDLRRPSGHLAFNLPNKYGLTTFLSGEQKLSEVVHKTYVEKLYVISSGPLPPNPSELVASERMKHLLQRLTKIADYIIVDSPPLNVADATTLASIMDASIFVINKNLNTKTAIKRACNQLSLSSNQLLGTVINDGGLKNPLRRR